MRNASLDDQTNFGISFVEFINGIKIIFDMDMDNFFLLTNEHIWSKQLEIQEAVYYQKILGSKSKKF